MVKRRSNIDTNSKQVDRSGKKKLAINEKKRSGEGRSGRRGQKRRQN